MKKCPWCGREFPDEVVVCAVDASPLKPGVCAPAVATPKCKHADAELREAHGALPIAQQFLLLLVRYAAAIAVAYLVSHAVLWSGMFLLMWAGMFGFVINFVAVGFCGVFFGTLCLPLSGRRFGSAVLLVLGLGYYTYFTASVSFVRGEVNSFPFVWLLPLAGGGLIALRLFWRHSSSPPTPVAEGGE